MRRRRQTVTDGDRRMKKRTMMRKMRKEKEKNKSSSSKVRNNRTQCSVTEVVGVYNLCLVCFSVFLLIYPMCVSRDFSVYLCLGL